MIQASAVVIDVNDLALEAAFWAGLLGAAPAPSAEEGWLDFASLGGGRLSLQVIGEAKQRKDRLHLDLKVDDLATGQPTRTLIPSP